MTDRPIDLPAAAPEPHWHEHDVPREARAFQGRPAGIVTRGIAATVDGLAVLLFGAGVWVGCAAVVFIIRPSHFSFPSPTLGLAMTALGVFAWVYLTAGWATSGRTAGNQLLGLRVLTGHGERLAWGVSAVRALMYIVFPAGLLWAAVSSRCRSVQDLLLRTQVIYDWRRKPGHVEVYDGDDAQDPS